MNWLILYLSENVHNDDDDHSDGKDIYINWFTPKEIKRRLVGSFL